MAQKRAERTKTEHSHCKLLDKPAVFTITYKDYGPHGWEFWDIKCSCEAENNKAGECTCKLRKGALLARRKM